jgi:hypothetical protein
MLHLVTCGGSTVASAEAADANSFFTEEKYNCMTFIGQKMEELKSLQNEEGLKLIEEIIRVFEVVKTSFVRLYRKYGEVIYYEDHSIIPLCPECGPVIRSFGKKGRLSKKRLDELVKTHGMSIFLYLPGENLRRYLSKNGNPVAPDSDEGENE